MCCFLLRVFHRLLIYFYFYQNWHFDCLAFEMLYIKKLKPNLNVQADSIRAKRFVSLTCNFCNCHGSHRLLFFLVFIEPSFYVVFDLIMTLW